MNDLMNRSLAYMCFCLMAQYEVTLAIVLKLALILGHTAMLVFLWLHC